MSEFIQWLNTPEAHNVRHALALAGFFLVLALVRWVFSVLQFRHARSQARNDAEAMTAAQEAWRQRLIGYGDSEQPPS